VPCYWSCPTLRARVAGLQPKNYVRGGTSGGYAIPSIGDVSGSLCAIEVGEVGRPVHRVLRIRHVLEPFLKSTEESAGNSHIAPHSGGASVLPVFSIPEKPFSTNAEVCKDGPTRRLFSRPSPSPLLGELEAPSPE